jgi:Uma2 family endonuclease
MTVAELPTTVITPEELLCIPGNSTMELVDGQIVEKNVGTESSEIESLFGFQLQLHVHTKFRNAKVYSASLGYQCFPDDPLKIRRPDTTVILLDRLAKLGDPNPGYMPIVPDLAVEVISPNDVVYDVDAKVQEYQRAGFPLIWVADPKARTVTVYPLNGRPVIYTADDELSAEAVLPGFRCKVRDFFPATIAAAK